MTHSWSQSNRSNGTTTFRPGSNGSIDGWQWRCNDCGFVCSSSIRDMVREDASHHAQWMTGQER